MPFTYHKNRDIKVEQQYKNAKNDMLPFIRRIKNVENKSVLEIGCGEGGVLLAFLERDCRCVGVDISRAKIDYMKKNMRGQIDAGRLAVFLDDVFVPESDSIKGQRFDIIILKDTIEHLYNHDRVLMELKNYLAPNGVVFIAFPPWTMPYGGHQQMAASKLGKLPWYHLLPRPVYRGLLKIFGESRQKIAGLMRNADTHITTRRFEKLVRQTGFRVLARQFYFINPIYQYKFGLKARKQAKWVASLPVVRDFGSTTCYYLIGPVKYDNKGPVTALNQGNPGTIVQ